MVGISLTIKNIIIMGEYITINIRCNEFYTADFLRQLANTIESQEEDGGLVFENENGHAEVIY